MSAKKIAGYRTCKVLITRTRTVESRFSVILNFLKGCTATDADISEQAALHASTAENPRAQRRTSAHSRKTWSTADCMQSGRGVHAPLVRVGGHSCAFANTVACRHAPSYDWQHGRLHAFTSVWTHTATAAGRPIGLLATAAACWRTRRHPCEHGGILVSTAACWHARSCDCQYGRLHAFTDAYVHTATAARMLSGEAAFIDGNFEEEARVRFLLHESVTKRRGAVSCQRGR